MISKRPFILPKCTKSSVAFLALAAFTGGPAAAIDLRVTLRASATTVSLHQPFAYVATVANVSLQPPYSSAYTTTSQYVHTLPPKVTVGSCVASTGTVQVNDSAVTWTVGSVVEPRFTTQTFPPAPGGCISGLATDETNACIYAIAGADSSLYRFNPAIATWSHITSLSLVWRTRSATVLANRYYAMDYSTTSPQPLVCCNLANGALTTILNPLGVPSNGLTNDGQYLYVAAGTQVFRYSPLNAQWQSLPAPPQNIPAASVLAWHDGQLYSANGFEAPFMAMRTTSLVWENLPALTNVWNGGTFRAGVHAAAGKLIVSNIDSFQVFDLARRQWDPRVPQTTVGVGVIGGSSTTEAHEAVMLGGADPLMYSAALGTWYFNMFTTQVAWSAHRAWRYAPAPTLTLNVTPHIAGNLVSSGAANSLLSDENPSDNSASVTTSVVAPPANVNEWMDY